jgi:glycine cleavage system H protein
VQSLMQWLKQAMPVLGLLILVILLLPVIVVVAFVLRPFLLVAVIVAAIAGVLASLVSPAFRRWLDSLGERQFCYNGLRLAKDVAVYPGHSWARTAAGDVAVGADDLVQAALGPVERVDLPAIGTHVRQGERLFSLRRADRQVDVRSPVSGTVVVRNDALAQRPDLVNVGPFDGGWAVRLRADNARESTALLRGKDACGWFRREIDRMLATLLADQPIATTLADGGTIAPDLHHRIDERAWRQLSETFFNPRL